MARPENHVSWWDSDADRAGRPIRPDVRAAAHLIWDSARRRVQALLGDPSEAPELMERSVEQVSRYLERTRAALFTQNTTGILMCAFCRALRRYAIKLNRLQFVGGTAELSERRIAANWTALVELRLDLEKLGRNLTRKSRIMLGLRSGGFDWKEIAGVLHMTETAARTVFWREIKRARFKDVGRSPQEKPAGLRESAINCVPNGPTVPRILESLAELRDNRRKQDRPADGEAR